MTYTNYYIGLYNNVMDSGESTGRYISDPFRLWTLNQPGHNFASTVMFVTKDSTKKTHEINSCTFEVEP